MSKSKKKVRKLTDEQYNAYISTLKEDAAIYNSDGSTFVPKEYNIPQEKDKQGD